MIVTYVTDDDVLVSVCHVGAMPTEGQARWQVAVEGMGGMARWGIPDLPASPRWPAERVARHALDWAQSLPDAEPCPCPDPDCELKQPSPARDAFGPTDPWAVGLTGPYLDREDAITAIQVRAGILDEDEVIEAEPTIEELVAELDGKPSPPRDDEQPPDPHKGSTWRLG